ncbi:MAG TPA: hypothetical protein VKF63_09790, partial [Terracidiphilus sp.]|nr:hypothetical protein [Terracidiphilus sp.]
MAAASVVLPQIVLEAGVLVEADSVALPQTALVAAASVVPPQIVLEATASVVLPQIVLEAEKWRISPTNRSLLTTFYMPRDLGSTYFYCPVSRIGLSLITTGLFFWRVATETQQWKKSWGLNQPT